MSELKKAIAYFEDAIRESNEIIEECSPALQAELNEQKRHFEVAVDALRRAQPENEPLTNAQRIRGMSDEDLAEYIFDLGNGSEYCYGHCVFQDNCTIGGLDNGTCIKGVIDWLRQPAETEK